MEFLKKTMLRSGSWKQLPKTREHRRGIPSQKKEGILRILKGPGMTNEVLAFWNGLQANDNSEDLAVARDSKEIVVK